MRELRLFCMGFAVYFFLALTPLNLVAQGNGTTRTVSNSITTVSQLVVPYNKRRKGLTIYNNSSNSVYITFGPTSAGATCTRILGSFTQFDMLGPVVYKGEISAIRNSGSGALIITEYLELVQ